MKNLIKKMLKLPFAILKKILAPLMVLWKCWRAVWERKGIWVYLLAGRYCKIKEKTVLWTAFDGRGILDNPRALFEAMLADSDFKDWKHIWVLDGFKNHKVTLAQFKHCKRVRFVEFKSWRHMVILATAKVIVDNITCKLHFRKRKGQIYVNTWHGIPLKYLGNADRGLQPASKSSMIRNLVAADYICSASPFLSEVYKRDFMLGSLFNGEIIERGYPRLDTFKTSPREKVVALLKQYGVDIDPSRKVILYAPTWRGKTPSTADVAIKPLQTVKEYLERVIDCSQYQVLVKPHQIVYNAARKKFSNQHFMVPATIDANEILAITDVLISDFSSIFYDFLLTKRPIVFYIPDLEEYKTARGLYHSVDTLPGPICQTLEELSDVFADLDGAIKPFAERYAEQRTWAGCDFDQGDNARAIMRHILLAEPVPVVEKEPVKKKILFTLPPRQRRSVTTTLIKLLKQVDYAQYDVTILTENDKIDTLERLAAELPIDVRVLVRRGAFRTFIDEVKNTFYNQRGALKRGNVGRLSNYFQEEIARYLVDNTFDEVIDVTGLSLFYTTLATFVSAKKRIVWIHEDLCQIQQTVPKRIEKVVHLYSAFDEVVFHNDAFYEACDEGLKDGRFAGFKITPAMEIAGISVKHALQLPYVDHLFDVSVVMAIHDVEAELSRVLNGLIKQNIYFESHVQLILVDDGSTDNSGTICDEYAARYPENIVVLHQEHQGIAAARNAGIEVAKGELLYFLDPDDKIPSTTLLRVREFARAHNDVDVITVPGQFYGSSKDAFPVNAKCAKKDVVIDLQDNPMLLQTICATTFIRREALGSLRFGALPIAFEEACLILDVLMKNPRVGAVKNAKVKCHSRKSSAEWIASSKGERTFYAIPEAIQQRLIAPYFECVPLLECEEETSEHVEEIPRIIQCYVAQYLQWMMKSFKNIDVGVGLSQAECVAFTESLTSLFQYAGDNVILNTEGVAIEDRLLYLRKKYQKDLQVIHHGNNAVLTIEDVTKQFSHSFLQWHSMRTEAGKIFICISMVRFAGTPEVTGVFAKSETRVFKGHHLVTHEGSTFLGEPKTYRSLYEIEVPIDNLPKTVRLKFYFTQAGKNYLAKKIVRHARFPLSNQFDAAYCILNKKCILAQGDQLIITDDYRHWKKELKLLLEIIKKRKVCWRRDLLIRVLYFMRQKLGCKPIWILKDRSANGDDNAEAMFIHLREKHPEVKAYFVIDKKSNDGQRLKQYGNILDFDTRKQRILCSLASVVLSSQTEAWLSPGEATDPMLRDLIALRPFVFLQHGVTKDFVSWLWKFTQNLAGLVAAATPEAQSFLDESYGYSNREIWLTGFPRFDRLYHDEAKQITFMPTWRQWLFRRPNQTTGVWQPLPGFTESAYFKFYNQLLSHPRLISAAQSFGYTLAFFPHPMVRLNGLVDAFNLLDVKVLSSETPYREIYAKSNLVVTDYSSAVFDFAYLRKPVLYTHFDKDEMFSGKHTLEKGYFDYERDGFGEVAYTLEETVDYLIDYMKQGCRLKDKYRERIDHFFAFNDCNNCERVYQKTCLMLNGVTK